MARRNDLRPRRSIKRQTHLRNEVASQRKWIESCENNGKSYAGSNGIEIREADNAHLRALEAELKTY